MITTIGHTAILVISHHLKINHPPKNHQVVGPVEPGKCRTNTRLACNNQPRQKCGKTVSSDDYYQLYVGLVENLTFSLSTGASVARSRLRSAAIEERKSARWNASPSSGARCATKLLELLSWCLAILQPVWPDCVLVENMKLEISRNRGKVPVPKSCN